MLTFLTLSVMLKNTLKNPMMEVSGRVDCCAFLDLLISSGVPLLLLFFLVFKVYLFTVKRQFWEV